MTIHRKVLKVRLRGSKEKGDLRPAISDYLPQGLNILALEYGKDYAICEIWGSDSDMLHPDERFSKEKLDRILKSSDVIAVMTKHPLSPERIGAICLSHSVGMKVDEARKLIEWEGKSISYKRTISIGKNEKAAYVVDEG